MSKVPTILAKIVLLMQITAFSLMQGYVLPSSSSSGIFQQAEGVKRVYYHQCGCPPEKVASHTCCCYTGKCTPSPQKPASTCHSCNKKPASSNISLLSNGGCTEESYGVSEGKFEFTWTSFMLPFGHQVTYFIPANRVDPETLPFMPPVPPPETILPFSTATS